MFRKLGVTLVALSLVATFSATVQAKTTPEARAWLEKSMAAAYDSPIKAGITGDMDMSALVRGLSELGEELPPEAEMLSSMTVKLAVDMVMNGPRHQRTTTTMRMSGIPQMPGGPQDGSFEMTMLQVLDGETMWMEMANPMLGNTMVMTMGIEQVEKIANDAAEGLGLPGGFSLGDPISQLKLATELMDFEVTSIDAGEVTLAAKLDWNAMKGMMKSYPAQGLEDETVSKLVERLGSFRIVLDERTALPKRFVMGDEMKFMTMEFSEYRVIGEAEIPHGAFVYTPPEGAQVMDLGALMQAMAPEGETP